jgi:hypothetical protein
VNQRARTYLLLVLMALAWFAAGCLYGRKTRPAPGSAVVRAAGENR